MKPSNTCQSFLRVPPFRASKYLITNREYLDFVNDGGYEDSKYWTDEGWNCILAVFTQGFVQMYSLISMIISLISR